MAETRTDLPRAMEFPIEKKRRKRTRWSNEEDEKLVIPGMPTLLPADLDESKERMYLLQLQIEDATHRLRSGDLGIPPRAEDRSPSPEPIYNAEGKRTNTREYRTRKALEERRHKAVVEMVELNQEYKPPSDYKAPLVKYNERVLIPQDDHPEVNFVGLLIGPRGNTLKTLEKETGTKIIIRGKGSVKEGKIGTRDGQPLPGADEPLHAWITSTVQDNVTKAKDKIEQVIKEGIEVPEGDNDLRKQQLRELALLNGTLREDDALSKLRQLAEAQSIYTNTILCAICGGAGHISQDCKERRPGDSLRQYDKISMVDRAKMDSEYLSLMSELGEGVPAAKRPHLQHNRLHGGGGAALRMIHETSGPMKALMAPPPLMGQGGMGRSQSMGSIQSLLAAPTSPSFSNAGMTQPPNSVQSPAGGGMPGQPVGMPCPQMNQSGMGFPGQSNFNGQYNAGPVPGGPQSFMGMNGPPGSTSGGSILPPPPKPASLLCPPMPPNMSGGGPPPWGQPPQPSGPPMRHSQSVGNLMGGGGWPQRQQGPGGPPQQPPQAQQPFCMPPPYGMMGMQCMMGGPPRVPGQPAPPGTAPPPPPPPR